MNWRNTSSAWVRARVADPYSGRASYRFASYDGVRAEYIFHHTSTRRKTGLAAGANPVIVKEAVGHADLQTTMRYTHLVKENLRSLVTGQPALAPESVVAAS